MSDSRIVPRKILFLVSILTIVFLLTGCCTTTATRTVGLPGLSPLASGEQVKLVEKIDNVKQPYQIVGQVSFSSEGFINAGEGTSYKQMKKMAADMGANGLIGIHSGGDGRYMFYYSGLAVKWLSAGETKQTLSVPFIVAVLPIQDQTSPDREAKISESLCKRVMCPLETKGYYVLPEQVNDFKGGIDKARLLGDSELAALGGENAQLLLGLTIESSVDRNVVVASDSTYSIRTTLMNKKNHKTIFEKVAAGSAYAGWLVNAIVPDEKRNMAAGSAAQLALGELPAINEVISE